MGGMLIETVKDNRMRFALILSLFAAAASAQSVTYFRVPGVVWGIAAGPDGNLWFPTTAGVAKMTPAPTGGCGSPSRTSIASAQ